MFVSGLSVNGFALLPKLTNLGFVTGSIVYHTEETEEIEYPSASKSMKSVARSKMRLMQTAYDRMQAQAQQLGASGIVGTHVVDREVAPRIWEYTVQGTAVALSRLRVIGKPFACTFTGQDYYALTTIGCRPLGIALGISVYYQQMHQRVQQKIAGSGFGGKITENVERSDFTRGLYVARQEALASLETEAIQLEADGVLGISVMTKRTLNRQGKTSQGMMIEFTALGTAIVDAGCDTLSLDYALPLNG